MDSYSLVFMDTTGPVQVILLLHDIIFILMKTES